jgi:hypothetical protein
MAVGGVDLKSQMAELVKARIAELRPKSFDELKVLPEVDAGEFCILDKSVTLTTFRSSSTVDELLIVVQAFRETLLGMTAQIYVEGFVASVAGERLEASEKLLWDYN